MSAATDHLRVASAEHLRQEKPGRGILEAPWATAQRVTAVCAVILLAPLMAVIALCVALLSGRAPLVAHRRIGRNGRPFRMLKFRTMWGADSGEAESPGCCPLVAYLDAPAHAKAVVKDEDDPRVTSRFARFLRKHSVDELPQLLHVAAGEMALVGPRPLLPSELEEFYGADAAEVLEVLPGMTGLWQVMGRSRLTYRQRRRLDLFLVRHNTPSLHWWILGRTGPQVVRGSNSW
jgi:lipopolysaccharide/colanic/teichoic acid biosynthesis glycosyltransferase